MINTKIIYPIKKCLISYGIPDSYINDFVLQLLLILILTVIIGTLFHSFRGLKLMIKQRFLKKELGNYYTINAIDKHTRNYIPTKYQNVLPTDEESPDNQHIASAKDNLIPLFLNKVFLNPSDNNKYYFILADPGIGKTTFLINLYLSYKKQFKWWKRKYDIKLFPLGTKGIIKDIDAVKNKENTILLLDAFDEDNDAVDDYNKCMNDILKIAEKFRIIIITSRTKFMFHEEKKLHKNTYFNFSSDEKDYQFQKIYLSTFSTNDINSYLRKQYNITNPLNWNKLSKAIDITTQGHKLLIRPILLYHIEMLLNSDSKFEYSYEIYEELIDQWIYKESVKQEMNKQFDTKELLASELQTFSRKLAINMYEKRYERGGLFIHKDEIFGEKGEIQLSDIEKEHLKTGKWDKRILSLVDRDSNGRYTFVHKSIMEYFIAKEMYYEQNLNDFIHNNDMSLARRFYSEMCFKNNIKPWSRSAEGSYVTDNSEKAKPVNQITYSDSIKIKSLILKKYSAADTKYLNGLFSLTDFILIDKKRLNKIYGIYLIGFIFIREKQQIKNKLGVQGYKNIMNYLDQNDLLYLRARFELFENLELLKLTERLVKLKQNEMLALLDKLELTEWLESLDKIGLLDLIENIDLSEIIENPNIQNETTKNLSQDLLELQKGLLILEKRERRELNAQLKDGNIKTITDFNEIKNYLVNMEKLQKDLPNCKIYY